jgi:hypothetical protein
LWHLFGLYVPDLFYPDRRVFATKISAGSKLVPRFPLQFTPELIENGRYRYEETDEHVHLIAQDFGVSDGHFYKLIERWGWRKREDRPPRGLAPEQRLLAAASQAVEAQAVTTRGIEKVAENQEAVDLPGDLPTPDRGSIVERLERAIEKELAAVEIMRDRYGPLPQPPTDAERTARTLSSLTETLFKVRRLRAMGTPVPAVIDDIDLPSDIDEFRHALARRIEAFVRSWSAEDVSGAGVSAGPASS